MRALLFFCSMIVIVGHFQRCNAQVSTWPPLNAEGQPDSLCVPDDRVYYDFGGYKSTETGWALALGATFVPIFMASKESIRTRAGDKSYVIVLLAVGAAYVGPSVGNLYAGDRSRALAGVAIRVLGTLFMGLAMGDMFEEGDDAPALGFVGLGAFAGSAIWNFATIGTSVRQHNKTLHRRLAAQPFVDPARGGGGVRLRVDI